ncbi:MAG TPA: hypothetical protein VGR26_07450 [Acidimicrobiales bacterium]|nr:hypothetical protein [Acidimicrobiales bacterium]
MAPVVFNLQEEPPPEAKESALARAWRDLWAALHSFWFWLAATVLGTVLGVAFHLANTDSRVARAVLSGGGAAVLGILLTVLLLFLVISVRTPFQQRNEARDGWFRAQELVERLEQQRRPRPALTYSEFEPLLRKEIAAGAALLSSWPEKPTQREFYELYERVDHWHRDVDEVLSRTHLNWKAGVTMHRPSLLEVPRNAPAVKSWIEETIRQLDEMVPTED